MIMMIMKKLNLLNKIPLFLGVLLLFTSCTSDDGIDIEGQLASDVASIDSFLAVNDIDAVKDPSGVRYVINDIGDGVSFVGTDDIFVTYNGTLFNGSEFDNVANRQIFLNDVAIEGWKIGLPNVNEGGSITLYIPSVLAFGAFTAQGLPANSNIIYNISVYNAQKRLAEELIILDAFLDAAGIENEVDDNSLIRYVIKDPGNGATVSPTSRILIDYEGRFLDGEVFDSGEDQIFTLSQLIQGWQIGIPLIQGGGEITLYIPSIYAYGPGGNEGIPGETPIIFDVTLEGVL